VSDMKRVGIDLHVVDGIYQGSRSHVIEVFSRVIRICPEIEFYLFLEKVDKLPLISPDFSLPNVHLIKMKHANPMKRLCVQLPALQKKYKLDVLHTQYVSPIPSFCKTMITLHDVLFESHPEYFTKAFVLRSKILMRLSSMRAAHIFTVSDFSKGEISNRYAIPDDQITTIYNGVDLGRFYPKDRNDTFSLGGGVLKSGEYILTVGRLAPRKNHVSLLRAYSQLDTAMPLVIIGQRHFSYHDIDDVVSSLHLEGKVIFLDSITDSDLASYYRHAALFVYPTWAEGFGMPIIEAMASGVPVVTSNTTSLTEVAADAAVLVSPGDVHGLRNAMDSVIRSQDFSVSFIRKGLLRAKDFDWDGAAYKVKDVYESSL